MGDVSSEPSMEEILSSIKRIIAEDSDATLSPQRGRRAVTPSDAEASDAEPEVLELTDQADEPETAEPEAAPPREEAPPKPTLVSEAAVEASRSSLAALSALVVKPEVVGSDTLEGMVREMLKPMLADWLDQRLPDVVERLVAQEIHRITARG
ncbi:MAG: DUF2497 domain-containing protein [Sphingomonadaceae bacterium]|nr:DUF2497 domain-containing protein [Sphingomonadaceae bacterium]